MQGPAAVNRGFRAETEQAKYEKHEFDIGHGRTSSIRRNGSR
jgi:hypothetical protein